jgi:hypothetical protein
MNLSGTNPEPTHKGTKMFIVKDKGGNDVSISSELKPVLFQHFEDTFLSDDFNRKHLELTGYFCPHTELLLGELEDENLISEVEALPELGRVYPLN